MQEGYQTISGGVTAPAGFQAAACAAGIKYSGRTDMAMLVSSVPCTAAGVFTSNVVKAAPVRWDREKLDLAAEKGNGIRAVIVNAGIANACTGQDGIYACRETAKAAASALGIEEEQVLLGSTGVIGMAIPVDRITAGVRMLAAGLDDSIEAGDAAAHAIMTTDTRAKQAAVTITLSGRRVTIGAMSKGVGMIHPNLCTMLCYVTTDARITNEMLDRALRSAVTDSFNMISVDGDMSTNDTVIVLANGLADNEEIRDEGDDYHSFAEALRTLCIEIAKMNAGDGEGATALLETRVIHADTVEHARMLAKSVIGSSLVKTMICGHDANGGRILCALGYAGVDFDPDRVDVSIGSAAGTLPIYRDGAKLEYDEDFATRILSEPSVTVTADLKQGDASATAWGCDLTCDYVKINADYRS